MYFLKTLRLLIYFKLGLDMFKNIHTVLKTCFFNYKFYRNLIESRNLLSIQIGIQQVSVNMSSLLIIVTGVLFRILIILIVMIIVVIVVMMIIIIK